MDGPLKSTTWSALMTSFQESGVGESLAGVDLGEDRRRVNVDHEYTQLFQRAWQ